MYSQPTSDEDACCSASWSHAVSGKRVHLTFNRVGEGLFVGKGCPVGRFPTSRNTAWGRNGSFQGQNSTLQDEDSCCSHAVSGKNVVDFGQGWGGSVCGQGMYSGKAFPEILAHDTTK